MLEDPDETVFDETNVSIAKPTSIEYVSVILSLRMPDVTVDLRVPNAPCWGKANKQVSDIHNVWTAAENPKVILEDKDKDDKAEPNAVTVNDPVPGEFDALRTLTNPKSYEIEKDRDPTLVPVVKDILEEARTTSENIACTDESDIHRKDWLDDNPNL